MTIAEEEVIKALDQIIASPTTQAWRDLKDAWQKKAARDEGIY